MTKLQLHVLRACAAASILSVPAVPPVLAQNAPATSATGTMEEITVTARRREENIQDVPIAVTAFSGEALQLVGTSDIGELAQAVPSVTFEPTRATSSTLTAFIRGVGQQDPLAGFEQGVALYVDDVYIARPQGSLLDIYDVERIEVLRGPQGTLYGRNAIGGAIKYVTRHLSDDLDFRAKASYGSFNQVDLVGTASVPIGDMLRVGGTVASLTRDGYGENKTTGEEHYDKDVLAYRISAEFAPNNAWFVRVAYDHTDDDSNPVAGYRPFPGAVSKEPVLNDLRDTLSGAPDARSTEFTNGKSEVKAEGIMGLIEWEISDNWMLRSITADREDTTYAVIDFDSLKVVDFEGPVIYDNEQFSQELQLLYTSDRLNIVAGAYYLDASAANDFDIVLGQLAGGVGVTAYTGGTVDTEAWSVFADVTYNLTDAWAFSLGGRYTEDKRSADIFRANYLGYGSPAFGKPNAVRLAVTSDYEAERTYDDFSPRVNIDYVVAEDLRLYASYSQGWKAGSYDPRGANFFSPEVVEGYDPETLDSYELGLKSIWLDGRARTNVAMFFSDYKDMQIPGSIGIDTNGDGVNDTFAGAVTNAGKSTINGLEFEGDFALTDKLSMQLAMSVLNANIEQWIFNGVDVSDQREFQNTPDKMGYLALTYVTSLAGGTLSINGNASYRDKVYQFEIPNKYIDQDAVTLANASILWTSGGGHWTVGLHGKNLTDEDVKTAGYCFGTPAITGCPSTLGLENNLAIFYGPPRTFTGTVEYRF